MIVFPCGKVKPDQISLVETIKFGFRKLFHKYFQFRVSTATNAILHYMLDVRNSNFRSRARRLRHRCLPRTILYQNYGNVWW